MNIAELEALFAELDKAFAQHIADGNVLMGARNEVQNLLLKMRVEAAKVEEVAPVEASEVNP